LRPKQITSVFSQDFVAPYLAPRIKLEKAMDSVQLQEILAELIRARIALRPGCTGQAISVEHAVLLMGLADEAVARAIEMLREMVPPVSGERSA
jgi:hypothetical protein